MQLAQSGFDALYTELSNWGRWGEDDDRGTLNFLTAESVVQAASAVRIGRTVSLAHNLDQQPAPDNSKPALHYMSQLSDSCSSEPRVNTDFVGMDFHGKSVTHLDALCHCNYKGKLYNGVESAEAVTSAGGSFGSVMAASEGITGRGVLLDLPLLRKAEWLEPGTGVGAAELERTAEDANLTMRAGDVVLVRTGHRRRRNFLGPWDPSNFSAGLLPDAMKWLGSHNVAVLGSDGDSDCRPSPVPGVDSPIHALALNAMGMPLIDNMYLEQLSMTCSELGVWEFLFTLAPLRFVGATGSPVNPIAIF
ncbi:cyclase family protein [Arthrobacter globiformis]|uniref:Cyclase family protein n=1 Tax=Arthrobacter globiformis TaxID=1665 RepID=A0A328HDV1_ARTGO|nr:cyclase family protein [Arthrobacter globiformis]RAM36749.1 cyclase family protein [Arthrobacter globiformis]